MAQPAQPETVTAAPAGAPGVLGPEAFGPTPAVTPTGHSASFDDTERRLRPLLRRVPITRVYDATPLDVLGLPVWCAVTPLTRDLTVHAGKGTTHQASRLSAMMEAVERVCGEDVAPSRTIKASYDRLRAEAGATGVVDPQACDLPFETAYRPDAEIRWVAGHDLLTGRTSYVPRDLVVSLPSDGVCMLVETNGLASGNTYTEATRHALYELVERHEVSVTRFRDLHHDPHTAWLHAPRMIDVATLPEACLGWADRIAEHGMHLVVRDVTGELGVPVFIAYVVDSSFAGAEGESIAFAGYGADLDAARAVTRAVTEAVQSHTGTVLGARDTFEGGRVMTDRPATLQRHVAVLFPERESPLPAAGPASEDLRDDLEEVLARLRRAGVQHCVVTDLTRADLGIPVVRVVASGLAPPYRETTRRPGPRLLASIVAGHGGGDR